MQGLSKFSGCLTKRGRRVRNWKYRFFHLTNKTCSYYANKEHFTKGSKPKGKINLNSQVSIGIALFEENKDKSHSFYIKTPERVYLIFASNEEQQEQWLNNLILHIHHPIQEKVEFLDQLPCARVSQEKQWTLESEEKVMSCLILTGIPKNIGGEQIKNYLKSCNILNENPVCKLIFLSRKENQWTAVKCNTIEQCIQLKKWIKKNPLKINNNIISTPVLIPRCSYDDIRTIDTGTKNKKSSKTDDVYLFFHMTGAIMRFVIKKKNNKKLSENYIKDILGMGHVKLIDIGEGYSNIQGEERIYSVIEYGYHPSNLKFFEINIHTLSLNKSIKVKLETTLKISKNPQKETINKQKKKGSRFDQEKAIVNIQQKPPLENVLINAIYKLNEFTTNQENFYILIGNQFLKNTDQLPLQNSRFDCFLIPKRNIIEESLLITDQNN
ncbi:dual adapter for phosphotyrosine and 3-phosphotyrosine and 3-phosphoinositide [Anaeramoeba flamelloides]|uniref:Dual adapter for phosphotyrosine and 3-phosphotyrosine and 3-phosphoinositide n=1 Tax=Anaeramoeba flamelloides TaxID=1746091 RepID=A0ABQ8XMM7_9EUKA|nr:dual adapter for phosphotyrosine and 3-phosphotyrosine and 3-phosphoinositide [Anaeramoeba flamelloides]